MVEPEQRDEGPTSDEAEGTEPEPAPTADGAPSAESTTLVTPDQDETAEVEDGQRETSETDEAGEPAESAEPEPLPTPEPGPRQAASKARPRRHAPAAPSLEESDPRFQPVLGRNDDAALVPFSTRLTPDLRRRLKLYSAVSGESTTSLTNRALDYMLEVAERKVGMR
ncbi:hypothetical protein [Cellulosimicrobium cellulans]|uniref:hypothetical protein n=1 Tax=Cellulosimicrobium cellulans TaxID=1710 RepID=UPI001BAD5002|nr:hypothetical protein [Cellulosimicrobium cellulans]QUC01870.1 hypothetical protein J5A69_19700 [Cellulosimicrobium cellulans]